MANSTLWDLTAETVMTAAHRLVVQETSAATRALHATFALLGGLEVNTTYNTAADHADISAAAGTLYVVNTSALASDMNFTLPVAASIQTGERVGVFLSVGDATYEMDLKSGASGDLINGTDHSTNSWSRLFITGECVIFRCIDGSTGDWMVEYDGRIPCEMQFTVDSDKTNFFATANTWYQVQFNTAGVNIGDCGRTSDYDFLVRRAGTYNVGGCFGSGEAIADTESASVRIAINNAATTVRQMLRRAPYSSSFQNWEVNSLAEYALADTIEIWGRYGSTANVDLSSGTTLTWFNVREVLP